MVGQRLGNYLIKREIGHGGMGVVYEASHEQIGRRAAIKVLRAAYATDAELGARFLNGRREKNSRRKITDSQYLGNGLGTFFLMSYLVIRRSLVR